MFLTSLVWNGGRPIKSVYLRVRLRQQLAMNYVREADEPKVDPAAERV